ncbi:MAG: hypothetical protein P8Y44_03520 [Acidobacteriota bacterium]
MISEGLVLLLESFSLSLQIFDLAGAIQRHSRKRRYRFQKLSIFDREADSLSSPTLLVQYGHVAQVDATIGQRCRQHFLKGPSGKRAVALRQ